MVNEEDKKPNYEFSEIIRSMYKHIPIKTTPEFSCPELEKEIVMKKLERDPILASPGSVGVPLKLSDGSTKGLQERFESEMAIQVGIHEAHYQLPSLPNLQLSYDQGVYERFDQTVAQLRENPDAAIPTPEQAIQMKNGWGGVQEALKAMEMRNPSRTELGEYAERQFYGQHGVIVEAKGRDPATSQTVYAASNEWCPMPIATGSYKRFVENDDPLGLKAIKKYLDGKPYKKLEYKPLKFKLE